MLVDYMNINTHAGYDIDAESRRMCISATLFLAHYFTLTLIQIGALT